MYFETVDWATLKPSLSSSPGIRGAPQSGFSFAHTAHEISEFLINPGPAAWIVRSPAPPNAKTHPVPFGRHTGVHLRHVVRIISVRARRSSSDSSMKRSVLEEPHRLQATQPTNPPVAADALLAVTVDPHQRSVAPVADSDVILHF